MKSPAFRAASCWKSNDAGGVLAEIFLGRASVHLRDRTFFTETHGDAHGFDAGNVQTTSFNNCEKITLAGITLSQIGANGSSAATASESAARGSNSTGRMA